MMSHSFKSQWMWSRLRLRFSAMSLLLQCCCRLCLCILLIFCCLLLNSCLLSLHLTSPLSATVFLSCFATAAFFLHSLIWILAFLICSSCILGRHPLMNRGSFLPPPLPFIHTLRSSSGCCFFRFPHAWRKVTIDMSKSPSSSTFYLEIFVVLIFMHHFFSSTTHSRPFFYAADPHIPTAHSRCYKFFFDKY